MKKIISLICLAGVFGILNLSAQTKIAGARNGINPPAFFPIPRRDIMIFPPPMVKIPVNETPIQLQNIDIQVQVNGLETETTTTMTFYNPNGRVLEGNLEFPLPSDATVTGYALDVNGKLVDGVIVPKEKARVVLETEIRRGVDPGILEHVAGNFFRTRIYPIPSLGKRTIRIISIAPLSLVKGDAAMHIPLPKGDVIAELNIEIHVQTGDKKPEIGGFGNLTFSEWNKEWVAKAKLKNVTPNNDLFINLPKLQPQIVSVEKFEEEYFASISDSPKVENSTVAQAPKKLKIAWDASGSRTPSSISKDREFLVGLFKIWSELQVSLVVFRNRIEEPKEFQVKNGQAAELFSHLEQLAYDGGTALSELQLTNDKGTESSPWLLFSDGFETIKESLPKFGTAPIHVVSSTSSRHTSLLRFLSDVSGGLFLDLAMLDQATALRELTQPQLKLLRVENPSGEVEQIQSRFQPGTGRASVYARFKKDTTVHLIYGHGGKEVARSTVKLSPKSAVQGQIIARAWAASRAMELALFAGKNETELVSLGRKYHLVTPGTSLIVLERADQYATYEIEPPHNMPEWREQYFALLKESQRSKRSQESSKIETVLSWWKDRVKWWEKKYEYPKGFKFSQNMKGGPSDAVSGGGVLGSVTSAPPPPVPSNSFRQGRESSKSDADSVSSEMMDAEPKSAPSRAGKVPKEMKKSKPGGEEEDSQSASISIKEWNPTTPYLTEIKSKTPAEAYATYLRQRAQYATSPAFFLDCSNYFFKTNRPIALRILSNLAELKLDDPALLRAFAWRLQEAGELDLAIDTLTRVRKFRPEEPQSHRDLALLHSLRLDRDKKVSDGVKAIELLNHVILGTWARFEEVEIIALMELNRVLWKMEQVDKSSLEKVKFVDSRLRKNLDLDVRITLSWDADATDMDLHVVEPSNEEAFYGHRDTTIGGLVSRDFTQGYGPEEYIARRAMPGIYKIRAKYFGSRQQTLLGPVTVTATVITHFGKANERRQALTLRLADAKEMVDIGEITIGKDAGASEGKISRSTLTRDTFANLKRGMDEKAVLSSLGTPERQEGGALTVYLYRLADGKQVRVGFGPSLLWVKEVHEGAEIEIDIK